MRTLIVTLCAFGAIAAPAAAQATATADPNTVSAGTQLHQELDATGEPVNGRVPTQTVLSIEKGFALDTKAVAKRCKETQAQQDKCPAKSAIGTAEIRAAYTGYDIVVPVRLFLAKPQQPGDLAGFAAVATVVGSTRATMGRIVTAEADPYGISVILPSPAGDLSGFPITFKSFKSDLGASRVVKKRVGRKGHKHIKRTRHFLIRTPPTCTTGTWASNAVFTFSDGSTAELLAPIACTA
ncbi:MAG: hypothetical protein QOI80_872 [Solirubrobacteraceae bacterium]|jgi:hypothetical protein|nr:hypothetical protein [Solirubrobacteraceae bacterium]